MRTFWRYFGRTAGLSFLLHRDRGRWARRHGPPPWPSRRRVTLALVVGLVFFICVMGVVFG